MNEEPVCFGTFQVDNIEHILGAHLVGKLGLNVVVLSDGQL